MMKKTTEIALRDDGSLEIVDVDVEIKYASR